MQVVTENAILEHFSMLEMDSEARTYLAYNAPRYVRILNAIQQQVSVFGGRKIRILDVGPSFLTGLLQHLYPESKILALGLDHPASRGGHWPPALSMPAVTFYAYDLRHTSDPGTWPSIEPIDLIVFSEVLEHLFISAHHVLRFLNSILAPDGRLLLTTPNAATLPKRIRFALLGKNPIPLFRENGENPGHFREFAQEELISIGAQCGLDMVEARVYNDSYAMELEKYHTLKGRLIRLLSDIAPERMRETHYVVYKRSADRVSEAKRPDG